jgi:DNA modification methylase
MKLKDIKPNPNNPRVLRDDKFQKLKQSITEFPKMLSLRPMVIDENNVVLGGNMRLRALQELGFNDIDEAWVKRSSDLTEEEKKRFIIADNVAFGEWDWDTLANDWEVVDLEAWGLDIPQFDTVEQLEASEDDYDVPEGGIETDIVIGDLFEIGEHRLLCGDSTDSDAVARLMNGEKADALLTDPPYGISVDKEMHKKGGQQYGKAAAPKRHYEKSDWDSKPIDKSQIDFILLQAKESIIWGGNYFELPPSRCWFVWDKENGDNNFADCELAWTNLNKPVRLKKHLWNGMIRKDKEERNSHPTQKPIGLIDWCIKQLTEPKIIIDPYLGSGSTMVAAHQLKRKCYGMELDPKYCQVIIDRMRKLDSSLVIKRNGMELKTS